MADGIPYFMLDCILDEKFEYIEARFGLKGFAILIKLYQRIYGSDGYYCKWNDRISLLFAKKIGADCSLVHDVVTAAISERIFSEDMFKNYGILTSAGIQKRYSQAVKRRAVIFKIPEYVIGSYAQKSSDVCNSGKIVCNSGENVCNSTTSRVEKSRVEKSRAGAPAPRDKLISLYGKSNVEEYERRFEAWKGKKGGNVNVEKYETVSKWLKQDGVKKPVNDSSFDTDEVISQIISKYQ